MPAARHGGGSDEAQSVAQESILLAEATQEACRSPAFPLYLIHWPFLRSSLLIPLLQFSPTLPRFLSPPPRIALWSRQAKLAREAELEAALSEMSQMRGKLASADACADNALERIKTLSAEQRQMRLEADDAVEQAQEELGRSEQALERTEQALVESQAMTEEARLDHTARCIESSK